MSLLASFNKRSKLNSMVKQTEQARQSDGGLADSLFKAVYQGYAEVLLDDPLRADALYHWGFALLHHAKSKSSEQAERLYRDALAKFDFCLLLNPNYLGAAINGGVAYMDLARLLAVSCDDALYDLAKKQFEKANSIHKGTASYNLACLYALRQDSQACIQALTHAYDNGSLPEVSDILADPDMQKVVDAPWFIDFISPLNASQETPAATESLTAPPDNDTTAPLSDDAPHVVETEAENANTNSDKSV